MGKKKIDYLKVKSMWLEGKTWAEIMTACDCSRGYISKAIREGSWGKLKKEIAQEIEGKAMKATIKKSVSDLKSMNLQAEIGCEIAAGIAVTILERINKISDGGEVLSQALTERVSLAINILGKSLELKRLALGLGNPGVSMELSPEYIQFETEISRLRDSHTNGDDCRKWTVIKVEKPEHLKN